MAERAKCPVCGCRDCGLPTHNCLKPGGCGFRPVDEDLVLPVSPPPHVQPYTGRQCPYSAVDVCNKCGWVAPLPAEVSR